MRSTRASSVGSHISSMLLALAVAIASPADGQQGSITGRVLAAGSTQPLVDGRVMVAGTNLMTATNSDGQYTLRNVPAGAAIVRVIRVGYQEGRKAVTVSAGQVSTLDFALERAIVQLQEIVTTATGQQARSELGNAVTTLGDVNARVETTPVTNLGDLLVAKAPGVVVLPGAMTGSAPISFTPAAESGERASANTWCRFSLRRRTSGRPIAPLAPEIRILIAPPIQLGSQ